jgi:hypothetical protein
MECVAKKNFKESIKIFEVFKTAQLNVKVSVFLSYREGLQAQFVNLFTFIQEVAYQVYYCSFLILYDIFCVTSYCILWLQ